MELITNPAPAFVPEPYLPWLRSDAAMQRPDAFVGTNIIELPAYAPMGRHFPAGTQVAVVRVTRAEDLTEGVYWYEHTFDNGSAGQQTYYAFGRFAGFAYADDARRLARRIKQGRVHFELSTDVVTPEARQQYPLRHDGTETQHMDFNDGHNFKLWRVTHYVRLPATALATLDASTQQASGATAAQWRWVQEERLISDERAYEWTAHTVGGFPEPEFRAVLTGEERRDFNALSNSLPSLTLGEAKKRKKGAVALTWRSFGRSGQPVTLTRYHRREEATLLLEWMESIAACHRAEAQQQAQRAAARAAAQPVHAANAADYAATQARLQACLDEQDAPTHALAAEAAQPEPLAQAA